VRNKVPDRLIDEPTARTGFVCVNGVNCGFGENDINTLFTRATYRHFYTDSMCMG